MSVFTMSLRILLLYLKFKWNSLWTSWVCTHHVPSSKACSGKLEFIFDIQHYEIWKSKFENTQKGVFECFALFFWGSQCQNRICGSAPSPFLLVILPSTGCHRALRQKSASSCLALQSTLPAMDKSSDLYIQSLKNVCSNSSLGKVNYR